MKKVQYGVLLAGVAAASGVGAGFLSFSGPGSGYVAIRVSGAVIALVLLATLWRQVVGLFLRNVLVLLFSIWSLLTVIWSVSRIDTLTSTVGLATVMILGAAMVILTRVSTMATGVMWLFTGTSVLSVMLAVLAPAIGTVNVVHPTEGALAQPIGVFAWNSDLGFASGVGAVIALALMIRQRRWLLLAPLVVNLVTVVYSNSAASVILTLVGLVVVLLLSGRWIAWVTIGTATLGVVCAYIVLGPVRAFEMAFQVLGRSSSLTGRTYLWEATWQQSVPYPWGSGFGVSPDLHQLSAAQHAHNGYLQVLFDRGWIGVLLIVAIISLALVRAIRHRDAIGVAVIAMVIVANVVNDYLSFGSLGLLLLLWQSYLQLPGVLAPLRPDKRGGRVMISAEVREEIEEILLMIESARTATKRRTSMLISKIYVDAPRELLDSISLPAAVGTARVIIMPSRLSGGRSASAKILGLAQFAWRMLFRRPAVLVSGFSMAKHRVISSWLGVTHIAYIRGAIYDASLRGGLADQAEDSWVARMFPTGLLTTYSADAVLTIGETNRDVIVERGVPADRVHVVGPVWLADDTKSQVASDERPANAFFVTAAWEAHGHAIEQEAQLEFIRRLSSGWSDSAELVLRVHPRDEYDYAADPVTAQLPLNRQPPKEFVESLAPGDLLISPLSTLAFEAQHLGHRVVFYQDDIATAPYQDSYQNLGIRPVTLQELVDGTFTAHDGSSAGIFGEISFDPLEDALRESYVTSY